MKTLTLKFDTLEDREEFLYRLAKSTDMDLTLYEYGNVLTDADEVGIVVHEQKTDA